MYRQLYSVDIGLWVVGGKKEIRTGICCERFETCLWKRRFKFEGNVWENVKKNLKIYYSVRLKKETFRTSFWYCQNTKHVLARRDDKWTQYVIQYCCNDDNEEIFLWWESGWNSSGSAESWVYCNSITEFKVFSRFFIQQQMHKWLSWKQY